jgi:hypothetical protein
MAWRCVPDDTPFTASSIHSTLRSLRLPADAIPWISVTVRSGQGGQQDSPAMHARPNDTTRRDVTLSMTTFRVQAAATAVFGVLAAIGANIAGAGDGLGRLLSRLAAEARAAL